MMDYGTVRPVGEDTLVEGVRNFTLGDILDCGQCFRWEALGGGSYRGTALGKVQTVTQQGDTLVFHHTDPEEFHRLWKNYFDLDRDYGGVKALLESDPVMAKAIAFTPGMRVLRQPPWEALCSFIISANNNILRIKGIVERLCGLFGEAIPGGWVFPTPERMAALTLEDLAPVRLGYRARYLLDAARLVAGGELLLEPLYTLPLDEARLELRRICGVGVKVAECALLYGFGRAECVPVDVWIARALETLYPGGMPPEIASVAGLGQQYLFHYVRNCESALQTV